MSLRAPGVASATASKLRLAPPLPVGRAIGTRRAISLSTLRPSEAEPTSTVGAGTSTLMISLPLPLGSNVISTRKVAAARKVRPERRWP